MKFTYLVIYTLLINSLSASFQTAEEAEAYITDHVMKQALPVLPDGLDIDGNRSTSGAPVCLKPEQYREPFEELRLSFVRRTTSQLKKFFAEQNHEEKLELRNEVFRLAICTAILGDPASWIDLGMMLNSPDIYLVRQQRGRHDFFIKQADLYANHGRQEVSFFSGVFSRFRSAFAAAPDHKYRKLD